MKLDENIKLILKILQDNGQGYIVGGFIRDTLLGLEPKDCDFVTDIEYDRLLNIFGEYSPKEIGKHFGIIQIKIAGEHYEIAKMRQDRGIPKDRKEQEIEFTKDIYEDLKRRDFTINAIAYDGKEFYYGDKSSRKDIETKTLRFVGECRKRIKEDPLRILRYFRFLATKDLRRLDKEIEEISRYRILLKNLSAERVREEFDKIIVGKNAYNVLNIMSEKRVLESLISEWETNEENNEYVSKLKKSIFKAIEKSDRDLIVRLAIFFLNINRVNKVYLGGENYLQSEELRECEVANKIMRRLKYDKKSIERVCKFKKYHIPSEISEEEKFVKRMIGILEGDIERYLVFLKAANEIDSRLYSLSRIERLERMFQKVIKEHLPVSIKDLKITGKNLLENEIGKGKIIGEILDYLLEQVLEHPQYNNKEKLLKLAKSYINTK